MATAQVTPAGAASFSCEIAELRPNSVLLLTEATLPFRSSVLLEVAGAVLDAEVVFAQAGKLALTFPTTPEIFEAIEAIDSEKIPHPGIDDDDDVLAAIDDALATYVTTELTIVAPPETPRPEAPVVKKGELVADDATELLAWCLTLLSKRPLIARVKGPLRTPVTLRVEGETLLLLDGAPAGGGWLALTARDEDAVKAIAAELRGTFARLVDGELPRLDADGTTVTFASREQYELQLQDNLANGALVVRTDPIAPGTPRTLTLAVPGMEPSVVEGTAMYVGDGTVGFSVPDFSPRQISSGGAPAAIAGLPEPRRFTGPLGAARLLGLDGDGGLTYLDILNELLAHPGRMTVDIEGDDKTVRLWIDAGRIAYSDRHPKSEDDFVGERLVAAKALPRKILEEALGDASPNDRRPLGAILLASGRVTTADLHRVLRIQAIERATEPTTFAKGSTKISPWREPPISGDLVGVSGGSVLSGMLRRRAAVLPLDDLRNALEAFMDGVVTVHLDRVQMSYRVRDKETKALAAAAQEPTALRNFLRSAGLRPQEATALVVLGRALGFLELEKTRTVEVTVDTTRETSDLEERMGRIEDGNHFDALEVHWAASHNEILDAYRTAKQRSEVKSSKDPATRALLAQLRTKIDAAFAVIGNRQARVRYRNELFSEKEREAAATHLIGQAELAVLRADHKEAENILDSAEELAQLPQIRRLRERCRNLRDEAAL